MTAPETAAAELLDTMQSERSGVHWTRILTIGTYPLSITTEEPISYRALVARASAQAHFTVLESIGVCVRSGTNRDGSTSYHAVREIPADYPRGLTTQLIAEFRTLLVDSVNEHCPSGIDVSNDLLFAALTAVSETMVEAGSFMQLQPESPFTPRI